MRHSGEGELSGLPETPVRQAASIGDAVSSESGSTRSASADARSGVQIPILVPPTAAESADSARRGAALARLVDIVDQALQGALPRDFEPASNQPQKLHELHIQMIMDAHQGASLAQLAEKYDYDPAHIGSILRHPDAITIKSYILGMQADKVTDLQSRIEALAPEALTVKVALMRIAQNNTLKDKIASDILSMAGYGERKKLEVSHDHKLALPAQVATGLADVLSESMRVATVDYTRFLAESPEGGSRAEARSQLGAEPTSAGSLPTAPPVDSGESRNMAPEEEKIRERLRRIA